ncbi:hypothetical protein ASG89_05305 [Paenibacillus sp. Soil766]|uniref:phytanoyl-CoA dioxygenase family protein n=1 Tax=Paenibacillus sp. Soil766 TaxID=1736404 RepID=UPI00070CD7FD|nr:hypothetical protein [Paenibacillus sp. Soil766]KRE98427.1 hypothetical protein ASG89_05305 [Paenibacillus sp. Soil766]
MITKVLTTEEIEQFQELGWVKVAQAFSREKALACQDFLWNKVEEAYAVKRDDPVSWIRSLIFHQVSYRGPEFDICNTQRMADAIEDLVGEGRWREHVVYKERDADYPTWGWWPVNFHHGRDKPWDVPTEGWHWDGSHFHHFVDSPDQGLLCLCLFSDVGSQAGGTLVAEGSHKVVAKFLADYAEGIDLGEGIQTLNAKHPWLSELTGLSPAVSDHQSRIDRFMNQFTTDADGFKLRVQEVTGEPGDVILCHPFLYHAPSQNHSDKVRFLCNRTTPLFERLNLDRADEANYSPLERSVRTALGKA